MIQKRGFIYVQLKKLETTAKVRTNIVTAGFRGKLGDLIVFRNGGKKKWYQKLR